MARPSILVVEDEEMIRDSLIEFLDEQGYDVHGAVDGRDALAKLQTADPSPCLILLDLMMPVMDGRAFREEQMRDPALRDIPVVVLSAYRDVAGSAQELAAAGYLEKPLHLRDLLQIIRQHCPPSAST